VAVGLLAGRVLELGLACGLPAVAQADAITVAANSQPSHRILSRL
jgi:predicted nicotinamide N-methyase